MIGQYLVMELTVFRKEVNLLKLTFDIKDLTVILNLASWHFQMSLISSNVHASAKSYRILENLADRCD